MSIWRMGNVYKFCFSMYHLLALTWKNYTWLFTVLWWRNLRRQVETVWNFYWVLTIIFLIRVGWGGLAGGKGDLIFLLTSELDWKALLKIFSIWGSYLGSFRGNHIWEFHFELPGEVPLSFMGICGNFPPTTGHSHSIFQPESNQMLLIRTSPSPQQQSKIFPSNLFMFAP